MPDLNIHEIGPDVVIMVKVVPGSSKTQVCGLLNGMIKIKIAAPPEKGKANQALTEYLADKLGLKKNSVTVISGHSSPVKQVRLSSVSIDTIRQGLGV